MDRQFHTQQGKSQQKRPHVPPDIANYLMLSVVMTAQRDFRLGNSLSKIACNGQRTPNKRRKA